MHYKSSTIVSGLTVIAAAALIVWALLSARTPPAPQTDESSHIASFIEGFGRQLQKVSLSGSREAAAQAIDQYYTPYLTPETLSLWSNDPMREAPGRLTSSPWPDHITVLSVTKNPDDSYTVVGDVVEMTSEEITHGGNAGSYQATIRLEKRGGGYLIASFQVTNPD